MEGANYLRTDLQLQHLVERLLQSPRFKVSFTFAGESESRRRTAIRARLALDECCNLVQLERVSRAIALRLGLPSATHCNPNTKPLRQHELLALPPLTTKEEPMLGVQCFTVERLTQRQLNDIGEIARKAELTTGVTTHQAAGGGCYFSMYIGDVPYDRATALRAYLQENSIPSSIEVRAPTQLLYRNCENFFTGESQTTNRTKQKERNMSNAITITTKTLINEQDAKNFTDAELYELIRKEEVKIEDLGKIKNKPKKLVAEIESRTAGIQKLVEFMDGRVEKPAA